MKRHSGFTLIELVLGIIVLGILSAAAVPKFINLKADEIIKGCDDCTFFYGYMPADIKTLSVMVDSISTDNSGDFVVTELELSACS